MIIDSHVHIGNGPAIRSRPEELIKAMDEGGVDKAVVIATRLNSCGNAETIGRTAPWRKRLAVVGVVSNPHLGMDAHTDERMAELDHLLRTGAIRGLKFNLGYQHFYPHDKALAPYLELLIAHGRPAVFHTGNCYTRHGGCKAKYAHPLELDELAVDWPALTIVMAHAGNPWLDDAKEVVYKNDNVVADCSGFVCGKFKKAPRREFASYYRRFLRYVAAPEKLMFGSDWPIAPIDSYVRAMEALRLSDRATELIMSKNARRIYGL